MNTFNNELFCEDLMNLRVSEKYTQQKLADILDINRVTLSNLENKKQLPSLEMLNKVCRLTGKKPNDYYIEKNNDPLVYMMATFEKEDQEELEKIFKQIMICEKYYELNKRCTLK